MAGFMRLQVWREKSATMNYGDVLPLSEAEAQLTPDTHELFETGPAAWWACYSAPGYMDRTETVGPFKTPLEAAREAFNLFGDNEHSSPDRKELAQFIWGNRRAVQAMKETA